MKLLTPNTPEPAKTVYVKAIFRVLDGDDEATAFFPEVPWSNNPNECTCYARVGQHGAASAVAMGRPATVKEASPLLRELASIGYLVRQVTVFSPTFREARIKAIAERA